MRRLAALALLTLAACGGTERMAASESGVRLVSPQAPDDGLDVVEAMHARYHGVRAPSLTFVQETVFHRPDGSVDTMTWYEAAVPGKLRIDVAPVEAGNGVMYADGDRYTFRNGELVDRQPDVNSLLLLLMDVYQQPTARTAHTLDSLGFDLSVLREATWEGRPVWVVGGAEGDEASSAFWVDRERLVPVRIVQALGEGGGPPVLDAHVGGYTEIDGVWHESEIAIYVDGRLVQDERYRDVRPGVPVDSALFDASRWRQTAPYWE